MKNKFYLFCCAAMLAGAASAQTEIPIEEYAPLYPTGTNWYSSFETWEPGQYVDDNFFISRVRPRDRFVNAKTQVYPAESANGKKVLWWMPISNGGSFSLNMPTYSMRNDIFSLWSYLDVHGGWNQGMIRSCGGFGDACHKNGVKNTVVIFFDQIGSIIDYTKPNTNEPSKYFSILFKQNGAGDFTNVEKFVKMFRYYGISGFSINPESTMTSETANKFQDFLVACRAEAKKQGWGNQWNVCWYDAMNNGGMGYSWGLNALTPDRINWFAYRDDKENPEKAVSDHFFLNYNHSEGAIKKSVQSAEEVNRSPYDVYVGQYIGGRGLGDNWSAIMENKISIGTWGEHSQNNIFYNSTDKGSAPEIVAQVYTDKLEMFFSGGNRNPQNAPAYITSRNDLSYESMQKFNGVATKVVAQSTLNQLPFITYFSLGSGAGNSEKGVKFSQFQWYNLGMQDMMPTWRWWVLNDANMVPTDAVKCDLSYDEAYMGGNSLKLSGATVKSNIRLFKTKFSVKGSENASLIFKVKDGTDAKLKIIYSLVGSEETFKSVPVSAATAADQWSTISWKLSDWGIKDGDVIACIGLSVENTPADYKVYIGGLSIVDPAKKYTPVKPQLVTTGYTIDMDKSAFNYETFKLIWNSKINSDPWEVVYNEDVDTWYFEVMLKEDGGEPKIVNRTTSWAALTVAQIDKATKTYQIGVRAVAPDGVTRSETAWLDQTFEHKYAFQTDIIYDARKLVPEEEFTVSLQDPSIPTAHWTLTSEDGKTIIKEVDGTSISTSCPTVGLYNLKVKFDNPTPEDLEAVYEKTYDGLIQVTPTETGRFPMADFMPSETTVDISKEAKAVTFTFNGVKGEGMASNAVSLNNGTHFFAADPAVLGRPNTLTIAAWVKPTDPSGQVMSLRHLNTNPSWGSTWIYIEGTPKQFVLMGRDRGSDFKDMLSGVEAKMGLWYHLAMVLDRDNSVVRLYINGKKTNEQKVNFKSSYDLYSLGTEGYQGAIDEVQFWDKALSDDEVKKAMYGFKPTEIPENLKGYWMFEDRYATNAKKFPNLGKAGDYPGGCFKGINMGDNNNLDPNVVAGSSWLSGSTPLKATLTWDFKGASNVDLTNPDAPVVTYDKEGEYPATLTVTNAWGTSTKTVNIKATTTVGIKDGKADKAVVVTPTTVEENFNVRLLDGGKYTISVYSANGMLVKKQVNDCLDNEVVQVSLNAPSGVYFVKVLKNEMPLEFVKIIKK